MPSAPPPAQPPAPHQVEVTLVAAGTVSDYGASEISSLRTAFASAAGVDVEALKARQVVHESEDDGGLVHTLVL